MRQFYAEILDIRKFLFAKAQTAKGAKRLLRKKRERWLSRILRSASTADPEDGVIYATWCNQVDSYWPGLFHCYADPRIPNTNNDMERFIKEMKQLERFLSRNPNPAVRFLRNAATTALVVTRPELPGERFLASRTAADLRMAADVLLAQRKKFGAAQMVRRDVTKFAAHTVARWKEANQSADNASSPDT